VQPWIGVCTQLPETLHTSVVQEFESSQSAADRQREQLAAGWLLQTPALHVSVVHASPSLQSASALQARQSATGSCEQTWLVGEQVSVVQALLSLAQSASVVQDTQPPSVALA
jgi:hypothetical protein